MANQPILVLGATGTTGRRVTGLLRRAGFPVRAASRSGPVRFEWTEPETWGTAVADAARMYLMAPHERAVDPAFVTFAVAHGIRHVVLLSSAGIEVMGDQRLIAAEQLVRDSGAGWTILRPNWFNQNFDEGFFRDAILAGELILPVGGLRQAFVDADDLAAVAATALTTDGHAGQSYEVTGPRALSFGEAVATIGREISHPVRFLGDGAAYLAAQTALGLAPADVRHEIEVFEALRRSGEGSEPTDVVHRLTRREPIRFEAYAATTAARGGWRG